MPFISQRDLERLQGAETQVTELVATNEDLRRQLAIRELSGRIALGVEEELNSAENKGYTREQAASMAHVAVYSAERDVMAAELAEELQQTRYDEFAAKLRHEEGPGMRKELDARYAADGTYARIEKDARRDVEDEVRTGLVAEKRTEVDAELATEEQRTVIREEIQRALDSSGEIDEYRQDRRRTLRSQWESEVRAAVHEAVDEEEAAKEPEFKMAYEKEVRASELITRKRADVRRRLEQEWKTKTVTEVSEAVNDEELRSLLEERAEQEKEKLRRENQAHRLKVDFESMGIDAKSLEEKTRVVVLLGSVDSMKIEQTTRDYRGWEQKTEVDVPAIDCQRQLNLIALGEGRFMVDGDSLHDSKSPYERDEALQHGTIIVLGRKIQENGQQALEQRIAADVPLYYDDDTTNPNIVDTKLNVADIRVNGVSARGIEHIKT